MRLPKIVRFILVQIKRMKADWAWFDLQHEVTPNLTPHKNSIFKDEPSDWEKQSRSYRKK